MPRYWNYSPLRKQPEFALKPKQLARGMAHTIFAQWASGRPYPEIADRCGMTADGVRVVIQNHIRELLKKSEERANVSALAREFKVARRTIIRDLQELIRRGELNPAVYPEWENPPLEDQK